MNILDKLSNEVLSVIVDHVDPRDITALTLTHSRWNAVCNRKLWQSVSIDSQRAAIRFLGCLTKARPSVANSLYHLRLQNVDLKDNSFNIVLRRAPCLQSFSLGKTSRISKSTLDKIASSWPNLISLSLPDSPDTQVPCPLERRTLMPPCHDEQQHHRHGKSLTGLRHVTPGKVQSSSRHVTLASNNDAEKE